MKKIILLFVITLSFLVFNKTDYCQTISEQEKQQYINDLADSVKSFGVIEKIVQYRIVEAIPTMLEQIWNKDPYEQIMFLQALKILKYEKTKELTYQYLSRVDNYILTDVGLSLIELKGAAARNLIDLGDYSKRQLLYDDVDSKHPDEFPRQIFALLKILDNYAPDKEKVTQILKRIVEDNTNSISRIFTLGELYKYYGESFIPYVIERFERDSENAFEILSTIFYENSGSAVHNYLQKYVLANLAYRGNPASVLIRNWGTPTDLMIVRKVQEVIIDEMDKGQLEWATNEDPFVLEHIQAISSVIQLTDSLISYHSQCASFNWLGNADFSLQLQSLINDAKTKLISGDSLGAAFRINQYQSAIVHAYQDLVTNTNQFVTPDGYKFLYYYPKYILERLPKLPIIKTITPAITVTKTKEFILSVEGNYFRPTSVISWNGKPCKTTFVSNTLLQTKIDLNDFEGREDKERKDGDEKKVKEGKISIPVWVTTNKWINTDTLTFRLYNKLQYPILPLLNCIVETSSTKYEAWFGYDNKNKGSVLLDHASENKFDPAPQDRGQPTVFLQGKHDKVFSVEFEGNKKLMWKLDKEKAEASKDSQRCK